MFRKSENKKTKYEVVIKDMSTGKVVLRDKTSELVFADESKCMNTMSMIDGMTVLTMVMKEMLIKDYARSKGIEDITLRYMIGEIDSKELDDNVSSMIKIIKPMVDRNLGNAVDNLAGTLREGLRMSFRLEDEEEIDFEKHKQEAIQKIMEKMSEEGHSGIVVDVAGLMRELNKRKGEDKDGE